MIDPFVLLTPILLLAVLALLGFVGCNKILGLQETVPIVQVGVDAVFHIILPTAGQTQSWQHTVNPNGTNRLLVVFVHGNTQARSVASVTYGTMQLTPMGRVDGGPGTFAWVDMWYLTNPLTGQQAITVTLDAPEAPGAIWTATSISFTDVDQMKPLSTAFPATGDDTMPSVQVPSATHDLVLDAVTYDDSVGATLTVGTGQAERQNGAVLGQIGFGVSTNPGVTTVTMSWTLSAGGVPTARPWRAIGVSVTAAPRK